MLFNVFYCRNYSIYFKIFAGNLFIYLLFNRLNFLYLIFLPGYIRWKYRVNIWPNYNIDTHFQKWGDLACPGVFYLSVIMSIQWRRLLWIVFWSLKCIYHITGLQVNKEKLLDETSLHCLKNWNKKSSSFIDIYDDDCRKWVSFLQE